MSRGITTVTLTWDDPVRANGIIVSYKVSQFFKSLTFYLLIFCQTLICDLLAALLCLAQYLNIPNNVCLTSFMKQLFNYELDNDLTDVEEKKKMAEKK